MGTHSVILSLLRTTDLEQTAVFLCRLLNNLVQTVWIFHSSERKDIHTCIRKQKFRKDRKLLAFWDLIRAGQLPCGLERGGGQSSVWEFKAKTSELFCDGLILWPLSLWLLQKEERGKTFLLCAMTCIPFQHSTSTKSGPVCLFELEMEVWYSGHLLCNVKEGVKFGHFLSTLSPLPSGQRPWAR